MSSGPAASMGTEESADDGVVMGAEDQVQVLRMSSLHEGYTAHRASLHEPDEVNASSTTSSMDLRQAEEAQAKSHTSKKPGVSYVRKAKERIFTTIGKKTTHTRNPRVDSLLLKIDAIKMRKKKIAVLQESFVDATAKMVQAMTDLQLELVDAWQEELGTPQWDEVNMAYTRIMVQDEPQAMAEMQDAVALLRQEMENAVTTVRKQVVDLVERPLLVSHDEEEKLLKEITKAKEKYKVARTHYSDAVIDAEQQKNKPSSLERLHAKKEAYDEVSDILRGTAKKYDNLFRSELPGRIAAHCTVHLETIRSIFSSFQTYYVTGQQMTLNWAKIRHREERDRIKDESSRQEIDRTASFNGSTRSLDAVLSEHSIDHENLERISLQ
ncbi:hypothetical protein FVE85_4721 [Porphyridium purpureum]|uniref:BAR domain-containing protein n=1 Tax=Porphyridium purpureum TaxID=35688 RepID=A0A5J4YSB0_PORPP|nr:hypothetical protein FVE85_4721 [Porphyridium purpureum]|eukprot:POR1606..scf236_6